MPGIAAPPTARLGPALAYGLALALLVFGAYARAIPLGFFSDDFWLLLFAKYSPFDLHWFRIDPVGWTPFYRPVALTIWKLLQGLSGSSAAGFRIAALALHVANSLLVASIALRRAPARPLVAIAAGALFAVLPTAAEALVWPSALNELAATCLFLVAMLCATRSCLGGSATWYVASLLAFQLSLWSKETAVVFPAVLALMMWRLPGCPRWSRVVLLMVPYAVLIGVNLLQRYLAWHSLAGVMPHFTPRDVFSLARRPIRALVFLSVPMQDTLYGRAQYWPALVTVVLMVIAGLRSSHHRAVVVFGLAWFLLTVTPSVPFLDPLLLEHLSQNSRYLYLPGVGFSIALAALVDGAFARAGLAWAAAGTGALITWFLVLIQGQVGVWRVADRAVASLPARIHQVLPNPRPFTCLQIVNPAKHYNGAFVYWVGLDVALLERYDTIVDVYCGNPYAAVPINSPDVVDDIFEVHLAFLPEARTWVIDSARGISHPDRENMPETYWDARVAQHFSSRMHAEAALRRALQARRPPPPVVARWDFQGCSNGSRWETSGAVRCDPSSGFTLDGPAGPRSLVSGAAGIRTRGWTEIIVGTDLRSPSGAGGRVRLSWRDAPDGQWTAQGVLPIDLPTKAGSHDLHFFIPPGSAARDLARLRLDFETGDAALSVAGVTVRELQ